MKNQEIFLLIVLFFLMGCTQTHFLSKESKLTVFKKINHNHHKTGQIKTTDGISFTGKNIFIASDPIFWIGPETNMRQSKATSLIKEIEFGSGGQYLAAAAGIGLLAGAFLGFVIGMRQDSKRITLNPFSSNPDPASGIKKNTIIGASVGIGMGLIIGIALTPTEKYVLDYTRR